MANVLNTIRLENFVQFNTLSYLDNFAGIKFRGVRVWRTISHAHTKPSKGFNFSCSATTHEKREIKNTSKFSTRMVLIFNFVLLIDCMIIF